MWEYKVICTTATGVPLGEGDTHHARMETGLNALGQDGWELCSCYGTYMFFKRKARTLRQALTEARRDVEMNGRFKY
jgi:Domain of unknown function (DUF4177)